MQDAERLARSIVSWHSGYHASAVGAITSIPLAQARWRVTDETSSQRCVLGGGAASVAKGPRHLDPFDRLSLIDTMIDPEAGFRDRKADRVRSRMRRTYGAIAACASAPRRASLAIRTALPVGIGSPRDRSEAPVEVTRTPNVTARGRSSLRA